HANATTFKIPAANLPYTTTNGFLRNIANGTNLPVTVTITRSAAGVGYNGNGAAPSAGTPLYNTFNGYVYFSVSTDANVEIWSNQTGTVTYTFSGLTPSKLYSFKGGSVR